MHIPIFFLSNKLLSEEGNYVLDPFSGSGTVLLESLIHKKIPIGSDCNPIARLVSKVKSLYIVPEKLNYFLNQLLHCKNLTLNSDLPNIINLNYWFYPEIVSQLHSLYDRINAITDDHVRDFFWVCFSNCAKKTSLANPRFSVPVKLKESSYPENHWFREKASKRLEYLKSANVYEIFENICQKNINRVALLKNLSNYNVEIFNDARSLSNEDSRIVPNNSISLIVTSPPYAGAQKYVRAQSLNLGWLGYCEDGMLKNLKSKSIGREDYSKDEYLELFKTDVKSADTLIEQIWKLNPLRAHIVVQYLKEMREALREAFRVLKDNGHMVLVIGNNQVCGYNFATANYLLDIAIQEGFTLKLCLRDNIKSRGLMTKRNKTAGIISTESVFLLRK